MPAVSAGEEEEHLVSGIIGMVELKIPGTHEGEFRGLPLTGREVEIWTMSKYVIEDGQVEEWYTYYDTAELQSQHGLSFPEVIGHLPNHVWEKYVQVPETDCCTTIYIQQPCFDSLWLDLTDCAEYSAQIQQTGGRTVS